MEASADIDLYNKQLIICNNKLCFEDNIIYDFEDRYHNISSFGMEQQVKVFYNLVKMIYETSASLAVKAENTIIFANLFQLLSEKSTSTNILSIGENAFQELYAYVAGLFDRESKLFVADCTSNSPEGVDNIITVCVKNYSDMKELESNHYSFLLVDFDLIQKDAEAVLNECYRLASKNSRILGYGSGEFNQDLSGIIFADVADLIQLGSERYLLRIDITDKKRNKQEEEAKKRILNLMLPKKSELLQCIQTVLSRCPVTREDVWYEQMDRAIELTAQLETLVAENGNLLEIQDLKYETNELKNALLDLKYEAYLERKHYGYFRETLSGCLNSWIDSIN